MLQDLSQRQLEQAMKYLVQPLKEPPPRGLEDLNDMEWFLLSRMLEGLLLEKDNSPVH